MSLFSSISLVLFVYLGHWEDLHYPKSPHLQDGMIHDLWNGNVIKPLTQEGGFLTYPEHLGLSLSTDGVPSVLIICLQPVACLPDDH